MHLKISTLQVKNKNLANYICLGDEKNHSTYNAKKIEVLKKIVDANPNSKVYNREHQQRSYQDRQCHSLSQCYPY